MNKFIDGKTTIEGTDELVKELSLTHINHQTKRLKIRIVVGLLATIATSITGYLTYKKIQSNNHPVETSIHAPAHKEVRNVTANSK